MKRGLVTIVLSIVLFLHLTACSSQDADINNIAEAEDTGDEYNVESSNDVEEEIEESLYDYSGVETLLSPYETISQNEIIWCLAYADHVLLKTDLSGRIYDSYEREDATDAEAVLSENRILFKNSDDDYYIYDFEMNRDVTEEYTGGDKEICYANSECVFLSKVEETYNSQDIYMYILDNEGKEMMSFSTNDMSEKYNVEWERNWGYGSCGSHIYYIKTDANGSNCCFIDLGRKKVYIVSDLPLSNSGAIFSDGEYIIDNQPHQGNVSINCDTEQVSDLDRFAIRIGGLSEGRVFCSDGNEVGKFLNVDGSVAIELNYENTSVTGASQFENGHAMLEFNKKFTTVIDTEGNFLFEPVEGTIYKLLNINGTNVYIIYKDDSYYFLDEKSGQMELLSNSDSSIYMLTETEEKSLVSFDGVGFSVIPVK